jgi:2-hydroxy-6-oxonona-2,4-dienedioate hydrolase
MLAGVPSMSSLPERYPHACDITASTKCNEGLSSQTGSFSPRQLGAVQQSSGDDIIVAMSASPNGTLRSIDWSAAPSDIVARLEAAATTFSTPCGDGVMAWRRWGERRAGVLPILFLHGGSGSWTHWIKVIPALAERTEIWAADMPGLGDSAMPYAPHTPANAGAVVAEGIRALLPHQPFHLIAFSFGAHVGTFAAASLVDQLATFTICGCAALGLPHNRLEFERERSTMTEAESNAVHRINLERLMFANPARIDPLAIHTHATNIRRARFKSRAFASTNEIPETLPRVTARLRAIWGAQDVLATPSVDARYDILRRSHPELQTRTIPDAGHWVAYEQPEAFVKAVTELVF